MSLRPPVFGRRAAGLRLERMRASSRFVDGVFRNSAAVSQGLKPGTGLTVAGEFLRGGGRRVPKAPLPVENPREHWARPPSSGFRATWLGHSTVLLEIDGVRVLTDPVWGERASPMTGVGPKRFHPAPVPVSALPPLDAVVISHDHYDHLDYPTILQLLPLSVPFYVSLGVGAHLEAWGVPADRIVELDWWETAKLPAAEFSITAAPAQHFSGRGLGDRNATSWSSLVMKGPRHSVFFSGDTGLTPEYTQIRERLGPFDLAMVEIGAFHPAWGDIHLGPANALEAVRMLGSPRLLPVHWGTFNLAIHPWDEPAETLVQLAASRDVTLVMPRLGQAIEPPHAPPVDAWWRAVVEGETRTVRPVPVGG